MVAQQTAIVVSVAAAFTHGIRCAPAHVTHTFHLVLLLDAVLLLLLLTGCVPSVPSRESASQGKAMEPSDNGASTLLGVPRVGVARLRQTQPDHLRLPHPQVPPLHPRSSLHRRVTLAAASRGRSAQRATGRVAGGGGVAHIAVDAGPHGPHLGLLVVGVWLTSPLMQVRTAPTWVCWWWGCGSHRR
jgi:hypothetical protein